MTDSTWPDAKWRKSSRSGDGDCVEVAAKGDDVAIRDSTSPDGAMLVFSRDSWQAFIQWIVEDADDLRPRSE